MSAKNALGKFQIAVGSTTASHGNYIVDENHISIHSSYNSDYSENDEDKFIMDNIYKKSKSNGFVLDSIMVTAVHGGRGHGVKARHLSKTWHIDENIAKIILDVELSGVLRKIILNSRVIMGSMTG